MQTQINITISPKDEQNTTLIRKLIFRELLEKHIDIPATAEKTLDTRPFPEEDFSKIDFVQTKRSVDARHGHLKLHLKYNVFINEEISEGDDEKIPVWKKADGEKSVIIVGSGPAGLFGALKLLEYGIKPIIIERGGKIDERKKSIAEISTRQTVDENSNYCFGEGGAGTFSDGKLYTRSNKRGNIKRILKIFVRFGANEKILTDAHPHIGTDSLPKIIENMRHYIEELGGEFHFNTKLLELTPCFENPMKNDISSRNEDFPSKNQLCASCENTLTHERKTFTADAILLATGHSANDIYEMLAKTSPESLEAKTFAIGVRVEHQRKLIDDIQYHKKTAAHTEAMSSSGKHFPQGMGRVTNSIDLKNDKISQSADLLGAAEYRLTTQVDGRGVYSFCMCPGGFVVPSQTGPDEIVVNGMSNKNRNSAWSNAAIVVETQPEDIPSEFFEKAKADGCPALAGLYYRRFLEKLAKDNGNGQKAPAQKLVDFLAHRESQFENASISAKKQSESKKDAFSNTKEDFLLVRQSGNDRITSYTPGIVASRLDKWLPSEIAKRLFAAFKNFDKKMRGFISDDALLIAIETRTSTPVRILRNKESFECIGLKGVYPAGEGSGYSGGIVSSAMDGENVCEAIAKKIAMKHCEKSDTTSSPHLPLSFCKC